jgi:multisubunit Na+/H+ antiporter MnhB subunit
MGDILLKIGSYVGALSAIIVFLGLIIKPLRKRIIDWIRKTSNSEVLLALLRDRITAIYFMYNELGYIYSYELENVLKMYDLYHKMNGNSYVDTIVSDMKQLRIVQPGTDHTDME